MKTKARNKADLEKVNEALQAEIAKYQRAEELFRRSEERFSSAFEHAAIGMALVAPDGHWLKVNQALCDLVGYSAEELNGKTFQEITHPDDLEADLENVRRLLAGKARSYQMEKRYFHKMGHVVWILLSVSLVRDAQGQPFHFISQIQDIGERKRAEAALVETSALLETLMKNTTDCIYFKDLQSRFVCYSHVFVEHFHLDHPDELKGKTDFDFFTEEHARPAFEDEREIIRTGKSILNLEEKETHRDGQVTWALTSKMPWYDKDGNIIGTWGISRDITERKKTERQLNVQYAVSRVLAEFSKPEQAVPQILQIVCENLGWDLGILWNLDNRMGVLRYGEAWSAPNLQVDEFKTVSSSMTFGRGIGLPGRVWANGEPAWIYDVVEDANFPRAPVAKRAGLHGAFAFPALIGNEVCAVLEFFSSELRQPDDSLRPIYDALGSQIGQFFQHKRLEDQLLQSQKMETVGKLAGGVAHEFNSIMGAIIGQSEFLLNDLPPDSPLSQNATEIRNAADRAATLTRQLLAYGRKQILQPENIDLNRLLANMESMLRHLMGSDVDVRLIPAADLKKVYADAGQIEQVIINMAINSREAIPHGGKLTIETANVTLDANRIGQLPDLNPGDYVMLAITDTGKGMIPEVQARIFEPFFSTKGVGQGTGLGLATCYGILKQSAGHLTVYSEPGHGTTFKIYLPQVQDKIQALPQRHLGPLNLPRGTETILLVEDDPALRTMASSLLSRLGYDVLVAANGLNALNLVEQRGKKPIDLLFTDVVMPELDGKELSERLRALHSEIKILFTSAYTENAIVHQGVLNPGIAFLQKPFTPSALAHKLREVLGTVASSDSPST